MGNPYRKHTAHRRDTRRAQNWKLDVGGSSKCSNCGELHTPHRVCRHCGFYDGKLVVPTKVKKSKKEQAEGSGEKQE
ncbi:MAG: 50S ribosomal protein L32 [Elusimicrobiota bacterium]